MPYNDDFSFLTDSEDEKTVDDIISQATDHLVLEQIAKLNSSSFDNTLLPSNLETRFRKLKSLPTNTTRAANSTSRAVNPLVKSKSFTPSLGDEERGKCVKKSKDENFLSKVLESKVAKLKELETKVNTRTRTKTSLSESGSGSGSGSSPYESDFEKSDSDRTKSTKSKGKQNKEKSNSNSSPSESDLDSETDKKKSKQKNLKSKSFGTENVSDMWRKIGGLFCSPKKKGKKHGKGNGKENRLSFSSLGDYDDDEDYLKSFSAKEQKKLMKKAMKEEEKLNKEAEKIVKWAKQASDRMMNVSGLNLDEDLSDFEK